MPRYPALGETLLCLCYSLSQPVAYSWLQQTRAGETSAAAQEYFLNEVQQGEEALASGDTEGCVEHLLSALRVAGNPTQLLQMYQQALPPNVFQMLVQQLPSIVSGKPDGQTAKV